MLNIVFGDIENSIYHPPTYFDNQYEDEWIIDPLLVEMIKDIDQSEVISAHLIESPVLGPISPREISGGVKTLMLMAFDDSGKIFNASSCGDNCAKWIVDISTRKELTINLHHVLDFRACLKNHSYHLHAPLCVIFAPNSGYIARYAPFIWHKSPTNCDAHLAESIFQTRSSSVGAFEAYMINTGKTVCSYEEYLDEAFRIKER